MLGLILQPMPATSYWTDSDNDGVPEEVANPPEGDSWWSEDCDSDGMTNAEEVLFLSDPYRLDSDFDGLTDRDERDLTPPVLFGGLAHTDPWDWDSNDNGYSDHDEYFYALQGRAPNVSYAGLTQFYSYYDADGDGIHNQDDAEPATMDRDGDGLVNWQDSYMDDYYNGNPPPVDPWYYTDDDNDGTINGNDPYPSDWWNGQPHYYWDGAERAGTWSDQDGDGTPDDFDPTPVPGYTYNGTFYAGAWSDRDGDSVPDPADPTPDGTYWYHDQEYPGPWADSDSDGIPNPADSIDSSNSHWYNGTEYSGPFADSDGDSIPNSADSWPNDPENGLDSDGDGLDNYTELNNTHTNASDVDSDDDYLTDGEEALVTHTNPNDPTTGENQTVLDFFAFSGPDTDNDGLPDLVENHYAASGEASPNTWLTPNGDLDGDGVSNLQAYWFGWDLLAYLNQYDMDGDGMTDAQEDYWSALHPGILDRAVFADAVADPDGDGLMNFEELAMNADPGTARSLNPDVVDGQLRAWQQYTTTPYQWGYDWSLMTDAWSTPVYLPCPAAYLESYDWDGNGLPDGYDAYVATYGPPPIPAAVPPDADGDGMPNLWEHRHGLRLRDARDAQSTPLVMPPQPQAQDFVDWERYNADYPGGGGNHLIYVDVSAYQNAFHAYILACDAAATHPGCDPDSDTLSNLAEHQHQTHPKIADSDGDGFSDGVEIAANSNARDPASMAWFWVLNQRLAAITARVQELRARFDSLQWGNSYAVTEAGARRDALLQEIAAVAGLLSGQLPGVSNAQNASINAQLSTASQNVPDPAAAGLITLESRQRKTLWYDLSNPNPPPELAGGLFGFDSEKTYHEPPQAPELYWGEHWEPFPGTPPSGRAYSQKTWPPWPADSRGHGGGWDELDSAYFHRYWPDSDDAEFSHSEVRASRTGGYAPVSTSYLLQIRSVQWTDEYQVATTHALVTFHHQLGETVSSSVSLTPLGAGTIPAGIRAEGGILHLKPVAPAFTYVSACLKPMGYVNGQGSLTHELAIATMENSLGPSDILDIDEDWQRFHFAFPHGDGINSVTVKLATMNPESYYDDDPTEIELIALPTSGWITPSMILVSDSVDDRFGDDTDSTPYGLDDEMNDRTHKVQLGGFVVITELKINGAAHSVTIPVRVPVKRKLVAQVFNFCDSGVADSEIPDDVRIANERLGQFGIKLTTNQVPIRVWVPSHMTESRIHQSYLAAVGFVYPNNGVTLDTIDDLQIYYAKELVDVNDEKLLGFAFQENPVPGGPTINLANTVFVASDRGEFTLAHEIVHCLTRLGHFGGPNRTVWGDYEWDAPQYQKRHALMKDEGLSPNFPGGSKRLYLRSESAHVAGSRLLKTP